MYGAHAFFRQLPSLCVFNIAEAASSMTSSSNYSIAPGGSIACHPWWILLSRLQMLKPTGGNILVAYSHMICSQPSLVVSVGNGFHWWGRGDGYEAQNPQSWRWKIATWDIVNFLLFQCSKPYFALELLCKEKQWIIHFALLHDSSRII